jgi:hypothetical protein
MQEIDLQKVKSVSEAIEGDWKPGEFIVNRKIFKLLTTINNGKQYVKPIQPVFTAEFEMLFDFGMLCEGFDQNRAVEISK